LGAWLKLRAKRFALGEAPGIAQGMGVDYRKIQIRDQRTRWGSCSMKGTVTFNWRLAMAPVDVFRYVIVHELAHRREMNHSDRFWAIVAQNCPEWRKHRDWLKKHGAILQIGRPAT
jgi:predicted metal-dependent hydrolase